MICGHPAVSSKELINNNIFKKNMKNTALWFNNKDDIENMNSESECGEEENYHYNESEEEYRQHNVSEVEYYEYNEYSNTKQYNEPNEDSDTGAEYYVGNEYSHSEEKYDYTNTCNPDKHFTYK